MQYLLQKVVTLAVLLAVSARAAGSDYHIGIGESSSLGISNNIRLFAAAGW